ncbi:MAG: 23S rRNA (pseudouridine(1915)-N(3))-methyltransferase RlmH [Bacteriovoracia bacterium]
MRIVFLTVGGFKSKQLSSIFETYFKRIGHFCKAEHQSIRTNQDLTGWLEKQKKRGTPSLFLILLDERGSEFTSKKFAQLIQKGFDSAKTIVFAVASSTGFDDSIQADLSLSLSQFTLAHELASVVLCEQVYRALAILNRHPYHHE